MRLILLGQADRARARPPREDTQQLNHLVQTYPHLQESIQ